MYKNVRTWWGEKFLLALEDFVEAGRLSRGYAYRRPERILKYEINNNSITAEIKGNKNPYFGVYKVPKYKVNICFKVMPRTKWKKIIEEIGLNPKWVMKLLLNEVPDDIDKIFLKYDYDFLPKDQRNLNTKCSCPDWGTPCKHIAGLYFKLAELLDRDPFLLRPFNIEVQHHAVY